MYYYFTTAIDGDLIILEYNKNNILVSQGSVNGDYSTWSDWAQCQQMENGTWAQVRTRSCTNPPPSNGGLPCTGPHEDIITESCLPGYK